MYVQPKHHPFTFNELKEKKNGMCASALILLMHIIVRSTLELTNTRVHRLSSLRRHKFFLFDSDIYFFSFFFLHSIGCVSDVYLAASITASVNNLSIQLFMHFPCVALLENAIKYFEDI